METVKSLQGILFFIHVSEAGSFSKAAQILGVSKSHVSKTIHQLELHLGSALFSRSTKRVELTSVGRRFLDNCKLSVRALEEAREDILNLSEKPRGKLRISLAGIFGENYVAPVAIEFVKKYPEVELELNFDNRIVDVIGEKFDLAIRFGHLPDSSLLAEKIASRKEVVCASKSYVKRFGHPKNPAELVNHNCLGGMSYWSFRDNEKKDFLAQVQGNFKSNNPRIIARAALLGLGIARLPNSYVASEIKSGKLVPLLQEFAHPEVNIWAVTPQKRILNANVDLFLKDLRTSLRKNPSDFYF